MVYVDRGRGPNDTNTLETPPVCKDDRSDVPVVRFGGVYRLRFDRRF